MRKKRTFLFKLPIFILIVFVLITALYVIIKQTNFNVKGVPIQTHTAIYRENQQEGTTAWKTNIQFSAPSDIWINNQEISGYATLTSVKAGANIEFKISTTKPTYTIEIYRIGWYNGAGARHMKTIVNLAGQNQPITFPALDTGLLALNWDTSYTLKTEDDWISGVYLAKLITNDMDVGFINFVLREDEKAADILFQLPVTSYQAYNNWGGKSLYDYNSGGGRAYKVSFDRPYAAAAGTGFLFDGDYNMIRFLESKGYELTYATSIDVESSPAIFNNRKVFLSNWHDEYWSRNMRNNLTSARDLGVDLAFFDANNIYQQIRFEPSIIGVPNRTIVCYKSAELDPMTKIDPLLSTVLWREQPVNEPENGLLGVMFIGEIGWGESFDWVVQNADHWVYEGTGLRNNDKIFGLIGYEFDAVYDNGYTPAELEILSASAVKALTGDVVANSSIYTAPSGARVFSAGTIYWPWKLDDNDYASYGADWRVQRMTANILDAMINDLHLTP